MPLDEAKDWPTFEKMLRRGLKGPDPVKLKMGAAWNSTEFLLGYLWTYIGKLEARIKELE